MAKYDVAQSRDANNEIIGSNESFLLVAPWTFVTANTGATGAHTLFTVTGDILVTVFGICTTNLTGAATLEVGVTGNTASLIAQIVDATTWDATEVYVAATVPIGVGALIPTKILASGLDIIMTLGSTAVTGGVANFYCMYRPLSSDGAVSVTVPA